MAPPPLIPTDAADATQEPGAIPLETPRPLYRRLGRRALRWVRPAAAPLLHRLELRVRAAVDRSRTADTLAALSQTTLRREALHGVEAQVAGLRAEINAMLSELRTELAIRLDALSLSHLRSQTFSMAIAALEERLETRRKDAQDLLRADIATIAAANADVARSTDRVRQQTGQMLHETGNLLQRSDRLLQRSDRLLQRYAVPLGTEAAVRTDDGYLLVPVEDAGLLVSMLETAGRLEPGTLSVMLALLQPGNFMVDVGANVGTLCLPASRRVGPGGRVLAIEPTERTASLLQRSLALNAVADRVEVLQCAVGEAEGSGRLAVSSALTHNSLLPLDEPAEHVEVTIRPLDACVAPGQAVDLVKLDVEGAELQAWRGMQRVLAESPRLAVIVEFGPSHLQRAGTSITDWLGEFQAPGFTAWEIEEATGRLHKLRAEGLADIFSINLLLLREHPSERPGLQLA